jgi:hypothetical protein
MSWAGENEDLFERIQNDCNSDLLQIPDLSSCKAASNDGDNSDGDSDKSSDNNDKEGAAALNGPTTALGAVLVAGVAAVIAL